MGMRKPAPLLFTDTRLAARPGFHFGSQPLCLYTLCSFFILEKEDDLGDLKSHQFPFEDIGFLHPSGYL